MENLVCLSMSRIYYTVFMYIPLVIICLGVKTVLL